jgi:hypothetical protein
MMELALLTVLSAWHNPWSDTHARTLHFMDKDPYDTTTATEFTGSGGAYIDGNGTLTLTGNAPRYRILDRFENVNVTFYAKRVDEKKDVEFAGFVVGARSQHYSDATCGANTYYARLTYDGKVSFEKELFHGIGEDAFYPQDGKTIFEDGVPFDKWIGIQFHVTTVDNKSAVLLQMYLDKNGDDNWQKVLEYKDEGNWEVDDGGAKCDGTYPENKILFEPGFVFIRNDGLGEAQYQQLLIQEVKP